MKEEYYNVDQIVSIRLLPKQINDEYTYHSGYVNFFGKWTSPYWRSILYPYSRSAKTKYSDEEILEKCSDCYIEDNTLWYKPYIIIRLSDGRKITAYCETVDELTKYKDSLISKNPKLINLETL